MVKLPVRFNPARLLTDEQDYFAEIPVAQFRRFVEGLSGDAGVVRVEMVFSREPDHHRIVVSGHFSADCAMECQRCLSDLQHVVVGEFSLTFVTNEKSAHALPDELDPVILDDKGQIHIVDMLEDDLILQMPVAPMHDSSVICIENGYTEVKESSAPHTGGESSSGDNPNRKQKNPFEVLKNLTKQD